MEPRNRHKHTMNNDAFIQSIILLGFISLLAWLDITNQLPLYINPRFSSLTKLSCCLLLPMFAIKVLDAFLPVQETNTHDCCHTHAGQSRYLPFFSVLLLAFAITDNTLNSNLVSSKGLNSQIKAVEATPQKLPRPLAQKLSQMTTINVTDRNYSEIVFEISQYPKDYIGKKIAMTGFVFRSPGLASNQLSLVRYVIMCCTADSLPYGLMCETTEAQKYPNGSWLSIQGVIIMSTYEGKDVPAIKITSSKQIKEPTDPYVFPNN